MTNKEMVPRPGPGPAAKKRERPKVPQGSSTEDRRPTPADAMDPPDSPQRKPSLNRP